MTQNTVTEPADSRRSRRTVAKRNEAGSPAIVAPAAPAFAPTPRSPRSAAWRRTALNLGAMTAATAIVATLALPGASLQPAANAESNQMAEAIAELQATSSQEIELASTEAAIVDASRGEFTATDPAALRRAQLAAERAAAAAAWSGPRVGDFLANPPYPNFSLDQVAAVARQYVGVPYRWGGSTPQAFDCSGLVQYVYAQFGVSLPHSVSGQAAAGVRISREDARPGDIVILNNMTHNGIYMGNGVILDAPYAGKNVQVRPLWTDAWFVVRVGI